MALTKKHKIIIAVASSVVGLFLLILLLPLMFEGVIADYVKEEANKRLKAKVEFADLDISIFKNFPRISVTLTDVTITNDRGEFKGVKLLDAQEVAAAVNFWSIFSDSYEISKVVVDNTQVNAVVGKSGAANWDIVKSDEELRKEGYDVDDDEGAPISLQLEQVDIKNLTVNYVDRESDMLLSLKNLNAHSTGSIDGDIMKLNIEGKAPSLSFEMLGIPVMQNVVLTAQMDTEIDMDKFKFTFHKNKILLNSIQAYLDGYITMLDDGFDMNLSLNTAKSSFANLLSLLPGVYTSDLKKLDTAGMMSLSAFVKGVFDDKHIPAFDMSFVVSDAHFKYPGLPAGIDDININANISNPGGDADATVIKVSPFTFSMAGQNVSLLANISNPVSDMVFDMSLDGKIDLSKIKDVYPMGNTTLEGEVAADLELKGKASYIVSEQLQKCEVSGGLKLHDVTYIAEGQPEIIIPSSNFKFTPKAATLTNTIVKVGGSDVSISASLENYLGYLFTNSTLKGSLNLSSNTINVDELLAMMSGGTEEPSNEEQELLQTEEGSFVVPANIDFVMQVNAKQVKSGDLVVKNVAGKVVVRDQKLDMSNLSMNVMGGGVTINGLYSTPTEASGLFKAGININNLMIADAIKDLGVASPMFESLKGSVSSHLDVNLPLEGMSPNLGALQSSGSLTIKGLKLPEVEAVTKMADLLGDERLKKLEVKDFEVDFEIKDGVIMTKPIVIEVSGYTVELNGKAKLDQTVDYQGVITLPKSAGVLSNIGPIPMSISGKLPTPKLSIDVATIAKNTAKQMFGGLFGSDEQSEEEKPKEDVAPTEKPSAGSTPVKSNPVVVDSDESSEEKSSESAPIPAQTEAPAQKKLPTKEEIETEVKEQLQGAASGLLQNLLGGKNKNKEAE